MKYRRSLIALILLVSVSVVFTVQAEESPPRAEVKEVTEGVYSVFLMHYNSLVVVGTDGVAITDPAFTYRAKLLKREIEKITDKSIIQIILSHEHYDHVGGTEIFPDADIICHASCSDVFALDVLNKAPRRELTFYDEYKEIDLGNQIIELHYFGPSDGIANTVVYLPKQELVYTADLYDGPNTLLPGWIEMDDVNLLGVRRVMTKILEMNVRYALDAHSFSTDPMQLQRYAKFIEDVYDISLHWIQKTLASGGPEAVMRNSAEFSNSVDLPEYKDWNNYDSLNVYVERMIASINHGG